MTLIVLQKPTKNALNTSSTVTIKSKSMPSLDEPDLPKTILIEVSTKSQEEMDLHTPPDGIESEKIYDMTERREEQDNDTKENDMDSYMVGIYGSCLTSDQEGDNKPAQVEAQSITSPPPASAQTIESPPAHSNKTGHSSSVSSNLSKLLSTLGHDNDYAYLVFSSMAPPQYAGGFSAANRSIAVGRAIVPTCNYTWQAEGAVSHAKPSLPDSMTAVQEEDYPLEAWSTKHLEFDCEDESNVPQSEENEIVGPVQLEKWKHITNNNDITHTEKLERDKFITPRSMEPRL
jgi:hypothetical protein